MASVQGDPAISFYATTAELFEWVREWVTKYRLHCVFHKFPGNRLYAAVSWDDPPAAKKLIAGCTSLLLDLEPFKVTRGANFGRIQERNGLALSVRLPVRNRAGMSSGFLGFVTRNARHLKVWRAIRQDLIDRTCAGVWFTNPKTHQAWLSQTMRYSPGVEAAVQKGMKLLSSGCITAHLSEPGRKKKRTPPPAKPKPMRRHLEPGDAVIWWQAPDRENLVVPVQGTVLAVNAQRVKVNVPDPDDNSKSLVRQVDPVRLVRTDLLPPGRRKGTPLTALVSRGQYWFGTSPAHICAALIEHAGRSSEPVKDFAQAVCPCGNQVFMLSFDEEEQLAVRECTACEQEHTLVESGKGIKKRRLQECECICGESEFQIVGAVAGYDDTPTDGKWFHIGCRCTSCGCTGCYATWLVRWCNYPWWEHV